MAYDINKYKKRRLYVKMPTGIMRWVHANYLDRAYWNMYVDGKVKACKGWIENDSGEWKFFFHDPKDEIKFKQDYELERISYPNRSAIDIAKRRIEESIARRLHV